MTQTVDFVPFATGSSANVEDQATYAADASTANGFSSGIASSAKFNKAMRQATFVASAIANWISTALGASVADDGNLTNFVGEFNRALAETIQSSTFLYAADTGAANAMAAALTPAATALAVGMEVVVKAGNTNTGPSTLNLNGLGAKAIVFDAAPIAAKLIKSGQLYALVYDGTSWQLQAPAMHGIVASSLGPNGYKVYSDGSIEQWGQGANTDNTGGQTITFPTPFPTACDNAIASNFAGGPPTAFHGCGNYISGTGGIVSMKVWSSASTGVAAGSGTAFFWSAKGR